MTGAPRNTGIDPVGNKPWGTHFCHFYETTDDLLETLIPFFKAGLESHEFCAWVVSEPLTDSAAWQALDAAVPRLDWFVANHSIEVLNARDVYLSGGKIDRHRIMANWNAKLSAALSRGYQGIRASGDMAWLRHQQRPDFMEYEDVVNRSVGDQRMMLLCTYPLELNGANVVDVMRRHQFATANRHGRCEVVETPGRPGMRTLRALITRAFAGLAGRCSQCGRGLVDDAPLRWCISGHTLHRTCVTHVMNREVCPICGIYVSDPAD